MKITILKSRSYSSDYRGEGDAYAGSFRTVMKTKFSERFIKHLKNENDYCTSCGKNCIKCRDRYSLNYGGNIQQIVSFPHDLPVILEEPEEYIEPISVIDTDVVVSIDVNEEILYSFVKTFHNYFKALIVPIEYSNTISPYIKNQISSLCRKFGLEISFPKPFCSFKPESGLLKKFREFFKIGFPEIELKINGDGVITDARVIVSAPCGASYYLARNLIGKKYDDKVKYTIDSALSSYPCTADSSVDPEFMDSIMHRAVNIQQRIFKDIVYIQ